MIVGIPGLNKFISSITISQLDDLSDRCNYFYTVLALLFFSLLIGTKQHFGAPIRCLVDRQYSGSWIGYVHDYCFISERYSLTPPEYEQDEIAAFDPTYEKKYENYYQWVPFLLAAQALAFYIPHFLWRWLQKLSNLDMATTVNDAIRIYHMFGKERSKAIEDLVRYVEQCVAYPFRHSGFFNFSNIIPVGWYSSLVYVLEKLLNITNSVIQLYVVNTFVGDGTLFWGFQLVKNLWVGQDWAITGYFPRVVYCDYTSHELANVQRKTVQCVLPINILNEKVFAVVSAWLLLLLAINVVSAIYTITILFTPMLREHSISDYLQAFICVEELLSENPFGNGDDFHKNELSADHLSSIANTLFHSRIRHRLYATIENCDNFNLENGKKESEEQKQAIFYRQLLSLAHKDKRLLHNFVCEAMHPDIILLLHFIQSHAGCMVTSDIVFVLWVDYVEAKESRRCNYQSRFTCRVASETPAWDGSTAVLTVNKHFNMPFLENNSAIMDPHPLLKANEEYAQVIDAVELCQSAVCSDRCASTRKMVIEEAND